MNESTAIHARRFCTSTVDFVPMINFRTGFRTRLRSLSSRLSFRWMTYERIVGHAHAGASECGSLARYATHSIAHFSLSSALCEPLTSVIDFKQIFFMTPPKNVRG